LTLLFLLAFKITDEMTRSISASLSNWLLDNDRDLFIDDDDDDEQAVVLLAAGTKDILRCFDDLDFEVDVEGHDDDATELVDDTNSLLLRPRLLFGLAVVVVSFIKELLVVAVEFKDEFVLFRIILVP
jgi:hypothetical protein